MPTAPRSADERRREAALLGDPDWLEDAVRQLPLPHAQEPARAAVAELVAGTRAARGMREP
ncbi:hypothetical protein [Kitasatospora sp. NPDC057541]|uniref:hypothetical protein n=1 Tax=unclassified Kitasatospora TaxID=2633591 RepID=UPI0036C23E74